MSKRNKKSKDIQPGMRVEASKGDLGEDDVSQAKVASVERDQAGNVKSVVVEKGVLFRKRIDVPAERVEHVAPPKGEDDRGTVTVAASEKELDALRARGEEQLADRDHPGPEAADSMLEHAEEHLPTADGLRRHEGRSRGRGTRHQTTTPESGTREAPKFSWRQVGPGFLSGMAGNDSSAVTSYSINGASNGYGQLWLMLISTPMLQAVQYACGKIGRVTQQGLAVILREHYGRRVALPASLILIISNVALIAADLVAIGSGLQLLTGLAWEWFVVPVAVGLWYLTVFESFGTIKKIFIVMSLAFVSYLITGIFSGANWGTVLRDTFVPQIGFDFATISSAVALLGATVSPYTIYWQVQGEKEQKRSGNKQQQIKFAALDIATGTISGNIIAYFIIVCTSATLFAHHKQIATAADAAQALAPLVGQYAKYLFAIGLIGAGLVAIPVLLASTSYAASEAFGWTASLWKKPWQNEGFYLILTAALVVSLALALLRFDPVQLMFWANVLQGVLAPVLVVFLILVGNNRRVMRGFRLGALTNVGLIATAALMCSASVLLFWGLATHQH